MNILPDIKVNIIVNENQKHKNFDSDDSDVENNVFNVYLYVRRETLLRF